MERLPVEPTNVVSFASLLRGCFEANDPTIAGKALEETHVEKVIATFEALGRGDLDAFLDAMSPDIELEICAPPEFPWIRHARGRDDFSKAVMHNFAEVEEQRSVPISVVGQGNSVVLICRERGRMRKSGTPYDVQFVYEFTFRDGKIASTREIVGPAAT